MPRKHTPHSRVLSTTGRNVHITRKDADNGIGGPDSFGICAAAVALKRDPNIFDARVYRTTTWIEYKDNPGVWVIFRNSKPYYDAVLTFDVTRHGGIKVNTFLDRDYELFPMPKNYLTKRSEYNTRRNNRLRQGIVPSSVGVAKGRATKQALAAAGVRSGTGHSK